MTKIEGIKVEYAFVWRIEAPFGGISAKNDIKSNHSNTQNSFQKVTNLQVC